MSEGAIQNFSDSKSDCAKKGKSMLCSRTCAIKQPYLILGGGSGFFAKSLAYPYLGEEEGLRWTAEQMKQMFRNHKHERDAENGISPHTMKYARFRGRLYPYGYCGVSIL